MISRADLFECFIKYDTDQSGQLELNELMNICKEFNLGNSRSEIQKMFAKIDTNKDGQLSFEEFLAWYRVGRTTKNAQLLKAKLAMDSKAKKLEEKMANVDIQNSEVSDDLLFQVEDGAGAEKTVFCIKGLLFDNAMTSELVQTIGGHFKDFDAGQRKFMFRLKSSDNSALEKGIQDFCDKIWLQVKEFGGEESDEGKAFKQLNLKTYTHNECVVLEGCLEGVMIEYLLQPVLQVAEALKSLALETEFQVKTNMDLTDLLLSELADYDNEKLREKKSQTGIIRLFLSGFFMMFAFRSKISCKKDFRRVLDELLDLQYQQEPRYLLNCLKVAKMKIKLSKEDSAEYLNKLLDANPGEELPDIYELMDDVGELIEGMVAQSHTMPWIQEFFDLLSDVGICDTGFSVMCHPIAVNGEFKCAGFGTMYKQLMEGFK